MYRIHKDIKNYIWTWDLTHDFTNVFGKKTEHFFFV